MSAAFALPQLPTSVLTAFGDGLNAAMAGEISSLSEEALKSDELRDYIFKQTRLVFKNSLQILFYIRTGKINNNDAELAQCKKAAEDVIEELITMVSNNDIMLREGRLSQSIEKYLETHMLLFFFQNGNLPGKSQCLACCSDEEYLGSILSFAQELSRYVINRACESDKVSIAICRELIILLNGKMLQFDFRNGNLRRKYDGLKYVLKSIEDITYEMSLTDTDLDKEVQEPRAKRAKVESTSSESAEDTVNPDVNGLIPFADLNDIKERMDSLDKIREDVIKQCRDIQKMSKQAIFSVHRGSLADASKKLEQSKELSVKIQAIITQSGNPMLRQGAFSNSLEEWAEGALTLEWIKSKRIISKAELEIVNSFEYIGALSDFTGEIGRIAVAEASKRNVTDVKEILECDVAISAAIMTLNIGGKYSKKADAVSMNLKKVESIIYDLSLLKNGAVRSNPNRDALTGFNDKAVKNDESDDV